MSEADSTGAMSKADSGGGHVAARGEGRKLFVGTLQVSAEQSGGSFEVIVSGLEGFFAELGDGLAVGKSSDELRVALAGKYDSTPTDH